MRSALLGLSFCLLVRPGVLLAADPAEDHLKKADELHAQGYFDRARAEYEAALRSAEDDWHILERLGCICFFKGEYQQAVEHFRQVIRLNPERKRLMLAYIALAHYHMRNYSDVVDTLADRGRLSLVDIEQMRILAKHPPYQIEAKSDQTVLPFLQLDPLPMVQIEVNSKSLSVFVDTGGVQLIVDPEFADDVGIHPVSQQQTKGFAGGKTGEVSFAMARSASLGDVTLKNVPVWILPTRCFSEDFGRTVDGVLGTEILMQFIPTIDYPNNRLILRLKNDKGLTEGIRRQAKACVPFILDGVHSMCAQCFINDVGPVLMNFDSGMADEEGASLKLSTAALAALGIEKPPLTEEGVGGAGTFRFGYVEVDTVRVGDLVRHEQKASYSADYEGSIGPFGFRSFGMVSHNFLKHYKWTIDFDRRVFLFE